MLGVLFAESAILGHRKPVGVVTLVFIAVVIAVLALGTFKGYFGPDLCFHLRKTPYKKITHPFECFLSLTHKRGLVNTFLTF